MAYAMNNNLVLGRLIENQVGIGRGGQTPQAAFARKLPGMGMLQQKIDNDVNAGLYMMRALR